MIDLAPTRGAAGTSADNSLSIQHQSGGKNHPIDT